jgi:hypothetical protein
MPDVFVRAMLPLTHSIGMDANNVSQVTETRSRSYDARGGVPA